MATLTTSSGVSQQQPQFRQAPGLPFKSKVRGSGPVDDAQVMQDRSNFAHSYPDQNVPSQPQQVAPQSGVSSASSYL